MADRTQPAFKTAPERSTELPRRGMPGIASESALLAIVKAAAGLFGSASAEVTILAGGRECRRVRFGAESGRMDAGSAFSATVIERNAPLFVADASSDSPAAIRFFAGVPLRTEAGLTVGALCVFDRLPRAHSAAASMAVLEDLGTAASAIVEGGAPPSPDQDRLDAFRLRDRALAACSSGIIIADARLEDTPITYCNPAFERITGYRRDEVMGLNCRFLQGPDTDPAVVGQLHDAIAAGKGVHVQLRNYRKNGAPFWNDLTISPVHDSEGRLTHFIGIQNDISDRIEYEREVRRLSGMQRAILDATNFPLVATSTAGIIVTLNDSARELLRLPPGDPPPAEVTSLFDPAELAARAAELPSGAGDAGAAAVLFTPALNGETTEREWTWIASDGSRIPMLLSCSPIRDASNETTGFLLSGIDLSERRTILDELHKLAAVVESSSDFVGISTLEGEVLYVNRAGRRMLGVPENGALPSRRMFRYVTPETLQLIRRTINPLVRRGERWEGSCTIRHFVTNEIVESEGSCFPVPGRSAGEHICLAAVLRNVTRERNALRALTHSEHRFSDVVAASGELVWEVNPDFAITYVSDRAFDLFGYEPAELTGTDFLKLVHPDDVATVAEWSRQDIAERRRFRGRDFRVLHRNGSVIWLRTAGVPVFHVDGTLACFRGVCLDVTGNRRTRLELEAAKEAAEEAARAKSLFLANMSHEIRTPLSGIIGMTSILFDSGLTASQREWVGTVRSSGEALLGILNDILDISKIESGRMEILAQSFDLHHCITDSFKLFQSGVAGKGMSLHLEIGAEVPVTVVGDSLRLRQILNNLIGNALKFAGPCSVRIKVSAQRDEPRGWLLRFDVADTGVGIPDDRMERLFKAFSQVDSSSVRQHGGAGLGLAICKRLAELMGGSMWALSKPGAGSTFSFTLRVAEEESRGSAAPPASVQFAFDASLALRYPLRILVAEDNPVNQKIALFLLRKFGYNADIAANGLEVLERLRTRGYDLILLDIQMPEMDGLQTAQAVRGIFAHPSQPWLVALTANARADDRREAEEAVMNGFLSKPVQGSELQSAIENAAKALQASRNATGESAWELPEGLREVLGDDARGVVNDILALYLEDSRKLVNEIVSAQAGRNADVLGRSLHSLKGSSSQVGAQRLSNLCSRAESTLQASGLDDSALQDCIGVLEAAWQQSAAAIRHWLDSSSDA